MRRRGSVLVLVMTLLGVLFVMGITLLTSMNFESKAIRADRQRHRRDRTVETIVDQFASVLSDGLISNGDGAFGAAFNPVNASRTALAELPGYRSLISPIEPARMPNAGGGISVVIPWVTDTERIVSGNDPLVNTSRMIDSLWPSGVPDFDNAVDLDQNNLPDADYAPVDTDGDGIVDALQVDLERLGFTQSQLAALATELNAKNNPRGKVYIGTRVIAHGGMVNLNASHPNLIANALGVQLADLTYYNDSCAEGPGGCQPPPVGLGYFLHRPSLLTLPDAQMPYSPQQEEVLLRRRNFLPPQLINPSMLHGNPLLDPATSPFGAAELATFVYPPFCPGNDGFEGVFENGHRYWPFGAQEVWCPDVNPSQHSVWSVRMEPFTSANADPTGGAYDRRHLVTTVSHDDLLARGGRVEMVQLYPDCTPKLDNNNPPRPLTAETDIREAMMRVNQCDPNPSAKLPLAFEYADYPLDLPNTGCVWPSDPACQFDPRKGRLQLSLAWLDEALWIGANGSLLDWNQAGKIIYDAFFMLVNNAAGPYWEEQPCDTFGSLPTCPAGQFCNADPNTALGDCYDIYTQLSRREHLISRTAASLTANMIDFADGECFGTGNADVDRTSCQTDEGCRLLAGSTSGQCVDLAIPTRIPIRSFDFTQTVCDGGNNAGMACASDANCAGALCRLAAGKELREIYSLLPAQHYVYGLERQPYITEVAMAYDPALVQGSRIEGRAVELFNPYGVPITGGDADGDGEIDFWLVEDSGSGLLTAPRIPINNKIPPGGFLVFANNLVKFGLAAGPQVVDVTGGSAGLGFVKGSRLYLLRRVTYVEPNGSITTTDIVVDQFTVIGNHVGSDPVFPMPGGPTTYSLQRVAKQASPWTCTVPVPSNGNIPGNTLQTWNDHVDPFIRPVEVNFANTGFFARNPDPNPNVDALARAKETVAFPTTGAMLLMMRHANRALDDYGFNRTDLAFTSWLNTAEGVEDVFQAGLIHPQVTTFNEFNQVDNGRMPVFDVGEENPNKRCVDGTNDNGRCTVDANCPGGVCLPFRRYAHHDDPAIGACDFGTGSTPSCVNLRRHECLILNGMFLPGVACPPPGATGVVPQENPGGLNHLPWGQLLFDYFTALPLRNPGPYFIDDPNSVLWAPNEIDIIRAASGPQVDLDGLRVHGRINLNAAPWKVLAGLPLIPMQKFSPNFRNKIQWGAGLVDPDAADVLNPTSSELSAFFDQAGFVGNFFSESIVAYRETRVIEDSSGDTACPDPMSTGDYGNLFVGRKLESEVPAVRRGTGFLSVGELANIRSAAASICDNGVHKYSYHRADLGDLSDMNQADFVEAIGLLAALGDWVTVRSQVFTVYGTVRGEFDPDILEDFGTNLTLDNWKAAAADVDSRAIRFQETIDRLPTVLGATKPTRIGERVIANYLDVRND